MRAAGRVPSEAECVTWAARGPSHTLSLLKKVPSICYQLLLTFQEEGKGPAHPSLTDQFCFIFEERNDARFC